MKRLRVAYGPSQTAFCQRYGFTSPQWSNYEAGSPPSIAAAMQMVNQIEGLTLDWIYYGRTGGLTVLMARRLEQGGDGPEAPAPSDAAPREAAAAAAPSTLTEPNGLI